ncbi:MAG: hypothetical protein ABIJ40_18885 [Bacteroidota bacterium]
MGAEQNSMSDIRDARPIVSSNTKPLDGTKSCGGGGGGGGSCGCDGCCSGTCGGCTCDSGGVLPTEDTPTTRK